MVVTEPDLINLNVIDSSQDLVIRWQGQQSIGKVGVQLQGDGYSIICRFVDDGEGIIPSVLIVQLRDALAGFNSLGLLNVSLAVSRTHLELIDLNGEMLTFSIISAKASTW